MMRALGTHMGRKKSEEALAHEAIEQVLAQIIDEWYERVAPHYVTQGRLSTNRSTEKRQEELKRFHDEKGHRIKFNKDELDFTYGLRSYWEDKQYIIEISVNNKVENFDYDDFQRRLLSHYRRAGQQGVPTPYELRSYSYQEIFRLQPNPEEAFSVERREEKADIMRFSFRVSDQFTKNLASHPLSSRQLLENYCVSPFRSIYARVYRRSSS